MAYLDTRVQLLINPYFQDTRGLVSGQWSVVNRVLVLFRTYPPNPRYSLRFVVGYACAYEEGGNCERFYEGIDEGYLIALCPRSTPSEQPERETIKGTLLPFPRRKGAGG